jgi:DNA-directed RNA polymerase subunit RPC12/RpoP
MAVETVKYRCLRCGYEYAGEYDADNPEERACPKCSSNSVRPLRAKKKSKDEKGQKG